MVDPAMALTTEAVSWFGDPEVSSALILSRTFVERLRFGDWEGLRAFNTDLDVSLANDLLAVTENLPVYWHGDAVELPAAAQAARDSLIKLDPVGEIYADQYVFLVANSWMGVPERLQRTLEAFRRVGVSVVQVPKERTDAYLDQARRHIPPSVLAVMKGAKRLHGPALLVAGGELVLDILVPPLGLALNIGTFAIEGVAVIAGDP
jgi:hypothetical protein